jgi:hypothetical protein
MANTADTPWTGNGTDNWEAAATGSSGPAVFRYAVNASLSTYNGTGACCGTGAWSFSTIAATTQSVTVEYRYTGFHAWYNAYVSLESFVQTGTTVVTTPMVPNHYFTGAGFTYTGTVTFDVTANDTYGFKFTGSNYDLNGRLIGMLAVCGEGLTDECGDSDVDGVANGIDNCLSVANGLQTDTDGVFDDTDNCPAIANVGQADTDSDGIGDACDIVDTDGDTIADDVDNCVAVANATQADADTDGIPNGLDRSFNGRTWVDASLTYSRTAKDADTTAITIKNSGASLSSLESYCWGVG